MKKRFSANTKSSFVRATVTIPGELAPFAEQRAAAPEHAGNFSSYVRALIIKDREAQQKKAA